MEERKRGRTRWFQLMSEMPTRCPYGDVERQEDRGGWSSGERSELAIKLSMTDTEGYLKPYNYTRMKRKKRTGVVGTELQEPPFSRDWTMRRSGP